MTELKPCPFCADIKFNDDEEAIETHFLPKGSRAQSKISCSWCGLTLYDHSVENLIDSWNTRPIEDAMQAYIEALEWEQEIWEYQDKIFGRGITISGWNELCDINMNAQSASAKARKNLIKMGILK